MSSPCVAKQALRLGRLSLSGARPSYCGVCPERCIFCDVWKLATLILTRCSFFARRNSISNSISNGHTYGETLDAPASTPLYKHSNRSKVTQTLDMQLQHQRTQIRHIISMCTIEGIEEYDGLRIACDRCSYSYQNLLRQKYMVGGDERDVRPNTWGPDATTMLPTLKRREANRRYSLREEYTSCEGPHTGEGSESRPRRYSLREAYASQGAS